MYLKYKNYSGVLLEFINDIAGTKLGKVYNIVIDGSIVNAEDKVKDNDTLLSYEKQSVYYTDTATIQGGESYYVEKGFLTSEGGIWLMTAQQYPELRNVNLDGNIQNPVIEEETDGEEGAGEGEEGNGEEGAGQEPGTGEGAGEGQEEVA